MNEVYLKVEDLGGVISDLFKEDIITIDNLIAKFEDLKSDYDSLKEEYEDFKEEVKDAYVRKW